MKKILAILFLLAAIVAPAAAQSQAKESHGLYNKTTVTTPDTYKSETIGLYEGNLRGTGGGGGGFDDGGGSELELGVNDPAAVPVSSAPALVLSLALLYLAFKKQERK